MSDEDAKMGPPRAEVLRGVSRDHENGVLEKLQSFYQESVMCDVTLTAGNCSDKAHKIVLAANSDYFSAMFSGNWVEQDNITLHDLQPCGLKAVLEFSYYGQLTVDLENIVDIIAAVHHCQLEKAYKPCEEYLKGKTNASNFLDIWKLKNTFNLDGLREGLLKFFGEDLVPAYFDASTSVLDEVDVSLMRLFLEKWNFAKYGFGQIAAFDFVIKWTKRNGRESDLQDLLAAVNRNCCDVTEALKYCRLTTQERALETKAAGTNLVSCSIGIFDDEEKNPLHIALYNIEAKTRRYLTSFPVSLGGPATFGMAVHDEVLYLCGGHLVSGLLRFGTVERFEYDMRAECGVPQLPSAISTIHVWTDGLPSSL